MYLNLNYLCNYELPVIHMYVCIITMPENSTTIAYTIVCSYIVIVRTTITYLESSSFRILLEILHNEMNN